MAHLKISLKKWTKSQLTYVFTGSSYSLRSLHYFMKIFKLISTRNYILRSSSGFMKMFHLKISRNQKSMGSLPLKDSASVRFRVRTLSTLKLRAGRLIGNKPGNGLVWPDIRTSTAQIQYCEGSYFLQFRGDYSISPCHIDLHTYCTVEPTSRYI